MNFLIPGFVCLSLLIVITNGQMAISESDNEITVIHRDYFRKNHHRLNKISIVTITNCSIEEIDSDAFEDLTALKILDLRNNNITEVTFGINTLENLTLSMNWLEIAPSLGQFPKLLTLNLSTNNIQTINYVEKSLKDHPLRTIDIANNPLKKVDIMLNNLIEARLLYSQKQSMDINIYCPKITKLTSDYYSTKGIYIINERNDLCVDFTGNKEVPNGRMIYLNRFKFVSLGFLSFCLVSVMLFYFAKYKLEQCRSARNATGLFFPGFETLGSVNYRSYPEAQQEPARTQESPNNREQLMNNQEQLMNNQEQLMNNQEESVGVQEDSPRTETTRGSCENSPVA